MFRPLPLTPRVLRLLFTLALGAVGAFGPYMALALRDHGLSEAAVTLVFLGFPIGRLLVAPLGSWISDRFRVTGSLLAVAWGGAFVSVAGMALLRDPVGVAVCALAYSVCVSTVGPVLDGLSIAFLGDDRRRYGRFRLSGSLGYLVATLVAGLLYDRIGLSPILLGAAMLAFLPLIAFRIPDPRVGRSPPILPALLALLRTPGMSAILAAACFHIAAISAYDFYFAVHVRSLGLPTVVASAAIALGVAVEVTVFWAAPTLLRRPGPGKLVVLATATCVIRWFLSAWATAPVAVVLVQALHGVTFGAYWIAVTQLVAENSDRGVAASAQNVLYLAGWGVGSLLGIPLAGALIAQGGTGHMFRVEVLVSLAATLCALLGLRRLEGAPGPADNAAP